MRNWPSHIQLKWGDLGLVAANLQSRARQRPRAGQRSYLGPCGRVSRHGGRRRLELGAGRGCVRGRSLLNRTFGDLRRRGRRGRVESLCWLGRLRLENRSVLVFGNNLHHPPVWMDDHPLA